MTKRIELTQGKFAIVDDEDFEYLNQFKWCANNPHRTWYAVRGTYYNGKQTLIRMHRLIVNAKKGEEVDHKDGNGLNNTRDNLRVATRGQNARNSKIPNRNTSGYKGVSWDKATQKWRAIITVKRKNIHLGLFTDKVEAAKVYDRAARKYHGEFARTNF